MQRTIFLLGVFWGCYLTANTQSRFPVTSSSVWRIFSGLCCDVDPSQKEGTERYKYFTNGDTLIDGKQYFKLYKTGVMYLNEPIKIENKYMGAIRDEDNGLYFIYSSNSTEDLLYNFDLKIGDEINNSPITSIDTLIDGRKRFIIEDINVHCGSANTIIEGIGWLGGLLEGNACFFHPGVKGSVLLCYSENDEPKFINTMVTDRCEDIVNNIPNISYNKPKLTINNDIVTIEFPYETNNYTINVYNLSGKQVYVYKDGNTQTTRFSISKLSPGFYVIRIENRTAFYTFKLFKGK